MHLLQATGAATLISDIWIRSNLSSVFRQYKPVVPRHRHQLTPQQPRTGCQTCGFHLAVTDLLCRGTGPASAADLP
jgi:hypothetical protein